MKHVRLVLLFATALLLVFAAASALAAPAAAVPIEPNTLETEPNDDIDTANYVSHGEARHGTIGVAGDVDFYRFWTNKFDSFAIDFYKPAGSPLTAVLGIYDPQGNLLEEATCTSNGPCLYTISPGYVDRFLKVSDAAAGGGPTNEYRITVRFLERADPYEPNDFFSEAQPIPYDQTIESMFKPCGDVDYYTFNGTAGDYIRINKDWWYAVDLLDATGTLLAAANIDEYFDDMTLTQTGAYYLYFHDPYWCGEEWYNFSVTTPDTPLYVSFSKAGTIAGIPFTSGDVLRYWLHAGTWEMFIDMSDLGLRGNLTALGQKTYTCYGEGFLFGFAAKYTHPDLGVVQPQDLVRFYPETTGPDTSGGLEFWIDGSDMGLTTTDERIDAVGFNCFMELSLSTVGRARIPQGLGQATFQDEDVLQANLNYNVGPNTGGTWRPQFDGSKHGVGAADVVGLDASDWGRLLLSFDRTVKLSGITFAPGDIAECHDGGWDWDDPCDYFTKFWDASDAGVGINRVDAFEVGDEE